ncbi:hypothetical protein RCL1_004112 [Eukaryota sp. TZLM3-RCL]
MFNRNLVSDSPMKLPTSSIFSESHATSEAAALMNSWLTNIQQAPVNASLFDSTESFSVPEVPPEVYLPRPSNIPKVAPFPLIQDKREDSIIISRLQKIKNQQQRLKNQLKQSEVPIIPPKPKPVVSTTKTCSKAKVSTVKLEQHQSNSQSNVTASVDFSRLLTCSIEFHRKTLVKCCYNKWKLNFLSENFNKEAQIKAEIFYSKFLQGIYFFQFRMIFQKYHENFLQEGNNYYSKTVLFQSFDTWHDVWSRRIREKKVIEQMNTLEHRRKSFIRHLRSNLTASPSKSVDSNRLSQSKVVNNPQSQSNSQSFVEIIAPSVQAMDNRHELRKKKREELLLRYERRKMAEKEVEFMKIEDEMSAKMEVIRQKKAQKLIAKENERLLIEQKRVFFEISSMNFEAACGFHHNLLCFKGFLLFKKQLEFTKLQFNQLQQQSRFNFLRQNFVLWRRNLSTVIDEKCLTADVSHANFVVNFWFRKFKNFVVVQKSNRTIALLSCQKFYTKIWFNRFIQTYYDTRKHRLTIEVQLETIFLNVKSRFVTQRLFDIWLYSREKRLEEKRSLQRKHLLLSRAEKYLAEINL